MVENKVALKFILSPVEQECESTTSNEEEGDQDEKLLRRGKWTLAEEEFMHAIVKHFIDGTLPKDVGPKPLRDVLAHELHCGFMRVTKKLYAICNLRDRRLGRLIYTHHLHPDDVRAHEASEQKLQYYREKFLASINPIDRERYFSDL